MDKTEDDVKNLKSILNSSSELKNFLKNPTQKITNQNNVINILAENLVFKKFKNFLLLLIEKRRIFFVDKILESFLRLCLNKRGEEGILISSKELSKDELEAISKDISQSMGSIIKFDYKFDKELIGGLKLQLGSFMIDTSLKNKLKKYEQAMLED